jgi:hypothetical protein
MKQDILRLEKNCEPELAIGTKPPKREFSRREHLFPLKLGILRGLSISKNNILGEKFVYSKV